MKPLVLLRSAEDDIETAFDYYLSNAHAAPATSFVMAVDDAFGHVRKHPRTGSLRYEAILEIPGLRLWLVSKFPYAVFYIEHPDRVDVLRVLHQHSDIPQLLRTDFP